MAAISPSLFAVLVLSLSFQTAAYIVLRRYSTGILGEKYSHTSVLAMGEVLKLTVSAFIIALRENGAEVFRYYAALFHPKNSGVMMILATNYLVMNLLTFFALTYVDGNVVVVMMQMKLATTAFFAKLCLARVFSWTRVMAMALVLLGVISVILETRPSAKKILRVLLERAGVLAVGVADAGAAELGPSLGGGLSEEDLGFFLSRTVGGGGSSREQYSPSSSGSFPQKVFSGTTTSGTSGAGASADGAGRGGPRRGLKPDDPTAAEFLTGLIALGVEVTLSGMAGVFMEMQFKGTKPQCGFCPSWVLRLLPSAFQPPPPTDVVDIILDLESPGRGGGGLQPKKRPSLFQPVRVEADSSSRLLRTSIMQLQVRRGCRCPLQT